MRFTLASSTPGALERAFWTRAWHAAQVIPETLNVNRTEARGGRASITSTASALGGATVRPERGGREAGGALESPVGAGVVRALIAQSSSTTRVPRSMPMPHVNS